MILTPAATAAVRFVAPTGGHVAPFDSWATAATNIPSAVSVCVAGDTIMVTNGTYAITNQIVVNNGGLTIRSVNGPSVTTIDGQNMTRCLYISHSSSLVEGFTVTRGFAPEGAGVYFNGTGGCIRNCIISDCVAFADGSAAQAGGISFTTPGRAENCLIINNRAVSTNFSTSFGGGVNIAGGGSMRNCTVYGNSAGRGAGVRINAAGSIENCTIYGNTATDFGGGMYFFNGGSAINSVIYGNTAASDGNITVAGTAPSITYCCTPYHVNLGIGNLTNVAPGFVDVSLPDLRLTGISPCLNAGVNQSWMTGETDPDGVSRIIDGTVDLGAYETTPDHFFSPAGGHIWPFAGWDSAATNLQAALDAAHTGDRVIMTNGTFNITETIEVTNGVTLTSMSGPTECIIDAGGLTRCLHLSHSNAVAGNLTLQNGVAAQGGGVRLENGAMLVNSVIRYCAASDAGGGALISTRGTLRNCLLTRNFSSVSAGGILCAQGGNVQNCTLIQNESVGSGGGMECRNGGTVENSIIRFNDAPGYADWYNAGTGMVYRYCASSTTNFPGSRNTTNDPLFIDLIDGRLSAASPCVNTGTNQPWHAGAFDLDRFPRLMAGTVDIGAYELSAFHYVSPAGANVWPYATLAEAAREIQDAIDAAAVSDVVVLTNGTYLVNALSISNAITLRGMTAAGQYATLDGMNANPCLRVSGPATVENLVIANGYSSTSAGGAYLTGGGTLSRCVIQNNRSGASAGGVWIDGTGTVSSCTITGNRAASSGGGLFLNQGGLVQASHVVDNQALNGAGAALAGGGILRSSILSGNSAGNQGGGIYFATPGGTVEHCTVARNNAGSAGGGIHAATPAGPVNNSIIYYNAAATEPNLSPTLSASNNCTYPAAGVASLTNDPAFVDFNAGDFHLSLKSPCVHRGMSLPWVAGTTDFGGNPRITGNASDLGAYEIPFVYVSSSGTHTPPFNTWQTASTNLESALLAAQRGWVVLATSGTYRSTSEISVSNGVWLLGASGAQNCIIDGMQQRRCARVSQGAILDGFTLTRGTATNGGGAYVMTTGRVQNCILTGNLATNGGAIYCETTGSIYNCLVRSNAATIYAGGIYFSASGTAEFCTIVDNAAYYGGGIYGHAGGRVLHSIIYTNVATGPTTGRENWSNFGNGLLISNSCTTPITSTYCRVSIATDPLFANAAGDNYHLTAGSPCLDRMNIGPEQDIDGNPRPNDGDGNGIRAWDMGAFELATQASDSDSDGLPDAWEIACLGGLSALPNADTDGDGLSNMREFLADTLPGSTASVFEISRVQNGGNTVLFNSSANRLYSLECRTSLTSGTWETVQTGITGLGGEMSIADTQPRPMAFYRVIVSLP